MRPPSDLARYFTGGATGTRRPRRAATSFYLARYFTEEAASSQSDEAVRVPDRSLFTNFRNRLIVELDGGQHCVRNVASIASL